MDAAYLPVEQYLPHRAPMLLVERLVADDGERVEVEAIVHPDGLFVRDGAMPSWVGVELMAQAVGVYAGRRRLERQAGIELGFLLGTRRYTAHVPSFPVGARLSISARLELLSEQGLAVFDCHIRSEGRVVAEALLNVFQPANVEAYLQEETGV